MVQDAVADEALAARHSLEYGMSIGPILTKLISKAISDPAAKVEGSYYVCPVCGNIEFGSPPDKCPFCGVDASDFVAVT
jgi:rubrerythrin